MLVVSFAHRSYWQERRTCQGWQGVRSTYPYESRIHGVWTLHALDLMALRLVGLGRWKLGGHWKYLQLRIYLHVEGEATPRFA